MGRDRDIGSHPQFPRPFEMPGESVFVRGGVRR